jgi:hypothetical protein
MSYERPAYTCPPEVGRFGRQASNERKFKNRRNICFLQPTSTFRLSSGLPACSRLGRSGSFGAAGMDRHFIPARCIANKCVWRAGETIGAEAAAVVCLHEGGPTMAGQGIQGVKTFSFNSSIGLKCFALPETSVMLFSTAVAATIASPALSP